MKSNGFSLLLSLLVFQCTVLSITPTTGDQLLGYAFSPTMETYGSTIHLPVTALNGDALTISFTPLRNDILYEVQVSTDLELWQTIDAFSGNANNPYLVTIESPLPVATTHRQFLRVKVSIFDNITDTNENGIPDAWEMLYFDALIEDIYEDADGDGLSNFAEYLAGTNPLKPTEKVGMSAVGLIVYAP